MYNIVTDEQISRGKNYQIELRINRYQGKNKNIKLLGPVSTLPLKIYFLIEGRELPTHDLISRVFKGFYR